MTEKCQICTQEAEKEGLCKDCRIMLSALYSNYDLFQLMTLFRHVLGIKVVQDLTKSTVDSLREYYTSENNSELH